MTASTTTKTGDKQILIIDRTIQGRQLKRPQVLEVPKARDRISLDIQRYIIESLSLDTPPLIPFALRNRSLLELAKYLKYDRSSSPGSLILYTYTIAKFSAWSGLEPDDLIAECKDSDGLANPKAVARATQRLDQYYMELKARGLAPKTVGSWVAMVKTFYRVNGLSLPLARKLGGREITRDRAPTPEELGRLLDLAELRERVVVTLLALGGFREGTLAQLRYRHVRGDLERGITPVHVHVEAEITKGKYGDYDTFLGREAADILQTYLDARRRGSPDGKIPPEIIHDESPLIRDRRARIPKPITATQIYEQVHRLYYRAGLLKGRHYGRYNLRVHSIRKYFRTQLAALGMDRDYIDYMMGHKVSTYHDIRMKGPEFLRNIYAASGLSIKPKTALSKIEALKEIIRAWGMNPEEILTREALSQPHRTYAQPSLGQEDQVKALSKALKEMMRKELLDARHHDKNL